MSRLRKIAIVGRPNVGKSALFNRIAKKKIAIVDEAEGITRDRLYAEAECFDQKFEIIDTGGIDAKSKTAFYDEVKQQAEIAIEEADGIILVVDSQIGVTVLDQEVSKILLKTQKPICLAVNKVDRFSNEDVTYPFLSLGISKKIAVSASQGLHIAELLETILEDIPQSEQEKEKDPSIKIALLGRPNVGKSSLLNAFLEEERSIVSPIPGTTRDSIDTQFTFEDELYTLIDTAGIRRKKAEHEIVDKFAAIRTQRAIERADVCLLLLDVQEGISAQDKKIAAMIDEAGKSCVVLFNKWDLVKGFRMEHCLKALDEELALIKHAPRLCISATTKRNLEKILPLTQEVYQESQKRISTHKLNTFIEKAMQLNHPPMVMGKRLRVYYTTQVEINPPRFLMFVNNPNLVTKTYKRYLYNQLRGEFKFFGVPLRLDVKGKNRKKSDRSFD